VKKIRADQGTSRYSPLSVVGLKMEKKKKGEAIRPSPPDQQRASSSIKATVAATVFRRIQKSNE
jgi:hypothetical protein